MILADIDPSSTAYNRDTFDSSAINHFYVTSCNKTKSTSWGNSLAKLTIVF
ncbi:MAG: hypothetical protein M3O33_23020 [Cyanobacteriota bacterium]|nr:hypothetical protein [Cyanobacteriota bacterium]